MSMLLTAFPDQYDNGVQTRVFDGIGEQPAEWKKYVNIETGAGYQEKLTTYSGFGAVVQWKDGEPLPMDEALEIGDQTLTQLFYGMGFKVTRKMVDYGQIRNVNKMADSLSRSVGQTYGVTHANLLNNAFTSTHAQFASKTLCSTTHTTAGSTRANRPATDVALTPANYEALSILGLNWVNYRGLNDPFYVRTLIVPSALRRIALKIAQSDNEPSTTDNDINTHKGTGVIVEPLLTSSTAWFIQAPGHGLQSLHGMSPTPINFMTEGDRGLVHGVEFDFVTGVEHPDGMVGTSGA